ncbi:VOC family protein [Chitinimonas viridis]|uniref:VOC family protein n=1 Tax=Chitinimonas viridis TaxID=664880 RepID=A0ABT8B3S6_9NEIS|nr:VOC family protein [Chitinimonas viridis]MDN3576664.1 VOC family protein [Chitinimonas viridis]
MSEIKRSNPVGINHLSLEVGNIAEAIAFYSGFLNLNVVYEDQASTPIPREELASLEMGDQFIALTRGDTRAADRDRHFGLVVDDKELVRENLERMGVEILPGSTMSFLDPWGNRIEIVTYSKILFGKSDPILETMGLGGLAKSERTIERMRAKGFLHTEPTPN